MAKWFQPGSRQHDVGIWLIICLLSETLPILALIAAHYFGGSGKGYRDVLGYTTLTLVSIGILAATLSDIIIERLYGEVPQLAILGFLICLVGLVGLFGAAVMLDVDATSPGQRRFDPNEQVTLAVELVLISVIFSGAAYSKGWMLGQFEGLSEDESEWQTTTRRRRPPPPKRTRRPPK